VPTPGPETLQFGGNTSCLEVTLGTGRRLIFDAGTGIVSLGRRLAHTSVRSPIDIFLTHFHWDHIQGLPFFGPLADPECALRIHADPGEGGSVEDLLEVQTRRPYSPVSLRDLPATVHYSSFSSFAAQTWVADQVSVTPFPVRHPDRACGFRIESPGLIVVYVPDNEPEFPDFSLPTTWGQIVEKFITGADLLIHDAMFTDEEYARRRGWGHGTVNQAIRLAAQAQARRLLLFHHHPDRTDEALRAIEADAAERAAPLLVEAAVEGRELVLSAPG
jgi:phosphoribosyl 1,2-cyclic phosphodiesterase